MVMFGVCTLYGDVWCVYTVFVMFGVCTLYGDVGVRTQRGV